MSIDGRTSTELRVLSALFFIFGVVGAAAGCAGDEPQSRYKFEVVDQPVRTSAHSTITVRLIDTTTGRPVDGAMISEARLTMRMRSIDPPGKGTWPDRLHSEEVEFFGSSGTGQYRLVGDVSMPGTWTLYVVARVPGEASPIERSTKFVASRQRDDP